MLYHLVACCIFVGNVNKWTKKVLESCVSRKVWTPRGCWQAPNHSLFSLQSISSPVWAKVRGELGQKGNKGSLSDALTMRSRELASSPQRPGGQPRGERCKGGWRGSGGRRGRPSGWLAWGGQAGPGVAEATPYSREEALIPKKIYIYKIFGLVLKRTRPKPKNIYIYINT